MGRKAAWCEDGDCVDHLEHVRGDGETQLILVDGKRPYLWIGMAGDDCLETGSVSDRRELRRIATAILSALNGGVDG